MKYISCDCFFMEMKFLYNFYKFIIKIFCEQKDMKSREKILPVLIRLGTQKYSVPHTARRQVWIGGCK